MDINIKDYMGLNIVKRLKTNAQRNVYMENWEHLYLNYGENVDWQKLKRQILLCDATKDYIYSVPNKPGYVQGTRPLLEAEVANAVSGAETDRAKVLKVLAYCRDLYLKHGGNTEYPYYGGTEEDLIEKGENLCECMGRLMVSLCEILGFAGRIVTHIARGHITCEIYIDGKWSYFDPRFGMFYVDETGAFLSVAELVENRHYILNQPEWVKEYISAQCKYEERQKVNYEFCFSPKEIQTFCDYSLMDCDKYNFDAKLDEKIVRDGIREVQKRYRYWRAEVFGTVE